MWSAFQFNIRSFYSVFEILILEAFYSVFEIFLKYHF